MARRVCTLLCLSVGLTALWYLWSWGSAITGGDGGRDPAEIPHRPRAVLEPKIVAADKLLTTAGGNYFDMPIRMDGALRKMPSGRTDSIMPPIFGASHASNLLELPDGTLLLVWFSGGDEGGDGVGIVSSLLPPGSAHWTKPILASSQRMRSAQNPVTFYEPSENVVRLLHTSQEAYMGQGTAEVRLVESFDGGKSWKTPKTLFTEEGAFVKNQLLRSRDGKEWLLPMYYTPTGFLGHDTQYSTVKRSGDGGRTWTEYVMDGSLGRCVQPTVVRLRSGTLRAWFRSRDADYIYTSDSKDDGRTWSRPVATRLPNNNSGIQAAMLKSGAVVMVFNNYQGADARYPLTIALSPDEGATWPHLRDLEPAGDGEEADYEEQMGEYSYPSVIQTADGALHVSYTFRRESIRYARISEDWIRQGATIGVFKS
mmetsp:Transcript_15764/g.40042  ORF Transcript_15764/g.40042 Transcript_15764/m.40042 type:complete len:426 (-) Transcript_15764:1059-2336(-)|eukprot:jgi/Tetstr1/428013/TSEL_018086.t1